MHGFSDSLRMELNAAGVSVTVICPYWVVTEFHERQVDRFGKPVGPRGRDIYTNRMMTADQCAQIILKAADRRRHEVLMGPGWFGVWMKMIAPGLMDQLIIKAVLEPILKRTAAARAAR
jgi:short-subunit dehydrogenase